MSKTREIPCKYYISFMKCEKGRQAEHLKYCQRCDKYEPRIKIKLLNKKKRYNEKQLGKDSKKEISLYR